MKKLYMIGNTHFDPVWLWKWDEAMASIRATFRSALDRMNEDEGFIYSFATPPVFEWIKNTCPDMFEEIKERVAQGRWDLCEAWWNQPDCYTPCGESFVRHSLYGQKYLKENFGKISDTVFNVDSFGHNPSIPQILKKSHIENYCFIRPEKHHVTLQGQYFCWAGIDGSKVYAYRAENAYLKTVEETATTQSDAEADALIIYGVTDHGGAPTKKLIAEINEREDAHFSTVSDFFKAQGKPKNSFSDELLTGDFGVYSNNPRIKRLNRIAENAVLNAEKASVIAGQNNKEIFEACWKDILFNQFHDILGGACIKEAYDDAERLFGRAITTAQETMHFCLQKVTSGIKTVGSNDKDIWNLVIWNLNCHDFDGYVEAEVQWVHEFPWYDKGIALRNEKGNIIECQVIRERSVIPAFRSRFVFNTEIPAFGYKCFAVVKTEQELDKTITSDAFSAETDRFVVDFSRENGYITSVFDKKSKKTRCTPFLRPICRYDNGDTWSFNVTGYDKNPCEFTFESAKVVEDGKLRKIIKFEYTFQKSRISLYYTFYKNKGYFDVRYVVNWNEKHYVLKLESAIENTAHTASVPYGHVTRHENSADMPVGEWLMADDTAYGFDGVFSYNLTGGVIGFTLLRSPIYGDLRLGEIDYDTDYDHISQGITEGNIRVDFDAKNDFDGFVNPPFVVVEANHDGTRKPNDSFIGISSDKVKISAVKHCEYDDGIILRLAETAGQSTTATINIFGAKTGVAMQPFEIKTLKYKNGVFTEEYMTEF